MRPLLLIFFASLVVTAPAQLNSTDLSIVSNDQNLTRFDHCSPVPTNAIPIDIEPRRLFQVRVRVISFLLTSD